MSMHDLIIRQVLHVNFIRLSWHQLDVDIKQYEL